MAQSRRLQKLTCQFKGWRGSIILFSIVAWVLAIANLAVSINMSIRNSGGIFASSVELLSGTCGKINRTKAWIQLAINAASMTLLASANFAMQAWTSLSREEIDRVHRQGGTVDIGIPSLRNLTRITPSRRLLWAVMFLFTIPVHIFYNSTLYTSSSASDYVVSILSKEAFAQTFKASTHKPDAYMTVSAASPFNLKGHGEWEVLSLTKIITRYGTGFPDKYRSVVLVADTYTGIYNRSTPFDGTLYNGTMRTWGPTPQVRWLCDLFDPKQIDYNWTTRVAPSNYTCRVGNIANTARSAWEVNLDYLSTKTETPGWTTRGNHTAFLQPWGLSERTELDCRVLSSPMFLWLTTTCNIVIASMITGMVIFYKSTPLVTVGDVIDSFLRTPSADIPSSSCTYDFGAFKNIYRPKLEPQPFHPKKKRLWQAAGRMRWGATLVWWLIVLFAIAAGFTQTWRAEKEYADNSMANIFSRGFDSLRRISMVLPSPASTSRRLQLVILANAPQLLLVATYLFYNSLLTLMISEREWHSFSCPAKLISPNATKGLRVSYPRGAQRSTFYLSLPYQYSIPLLVLSGGLQWLASQSLFFAEVDLWDEMGQRLSDGGSIVTLGYSNLALFWLLIVGMLAWLPVFGIGWLRKLEGGMPLMGGCSGVIAGACHLKGGETEPERKRVAEGRLAWGVIKRDEGGQKWLGFLPGGLGVSRPVQGEVYG